MGLQGLRQGTEYLKPSSGGGKFTPNIYWKDGDAKTIMFLSSAEEIGKVKFHPFVEVPTEDGKTTPRLFMCRKDPAWMEESGGYCPLCDDIGAKVEEKHCALALELRPIMKKGTPTIERLEVVTRTFKRQDGTEVEVPVYGLVRQGFRNFFNYFAARASKYGDINNVAYDISRMGNDQSTSYIIEALNGVELPDISEYEIPTLVEVLEDLGSLERYESELQGVEPGSQVDKYGDNQNFSQEETPTQTLTKFEELAAKLPGGQEKVERYK